MQSQRERDANIRELEERLIPYLRATGAKYVVAVPRLDGFARPFGIYQGTRPDHFSPVDPIGTYQFSS